MDFYGFWDSCAQNMTSEVSKNALSRNLGLLCAEQDVGNLKKWTFRNSGTPVRSTSHGSCPQQGFGGAPKKVVFAFFPLFFFPVDPFLARASCVQFMAQKCYGNCFHAGPVSPFHKISRQRGPEQPGKKRIDRNKSVGKVAKTTFLGAPLDPCWGQDP